MEKLNSLLKKFNELSMSKKILILAGFLFLMTSFIIMISYKSSSSFVPLYYNVPMDQAGTIIEFLKKNRINFKIDENTGTIKVPKDKVYEVRMLLAKAGIPGDHQVGFEIFNKTSFGVTEFVQKIDYLRALQGELARSIETIRGIKSARVHIVQPKESLFKDEQNPPTASVIITYEPGFDTLKTEQIKAIVNLVSHSIEGLKPKNVVVLDNYGNVLTDKLEEAEENITSGVQKKIEYKRSIEKYYQRQIQSMLERVLGKGKVVVRVNADIDFTKMKEKEELYDPDNIAERSHERDTEKDYSLQAIKGGVPGVVSNVPSVMAQQQNKGFNKNINLIKEKNHEIVNYEVSKTIKEIEKPVGVIKRLSVAVLVDGKYKKIKKGKKVIEKYIPLSNTELNTIKELVKKAIGYDPNRKDQIEVANIAFNYNELEQINKAIKKQELTSLIIIGLKYGLTILFLLFIFFVVFKPILKTLLERLQPPEVTPEISKTVEEISEEIEKERERVFEKLEETPEREERPKDKIVRIIDQDPDKVVSLLKEWLRSRT